MSSKDLSLELQDLKGSALAHQKTFRKVANRLKKEKSKAADQKIHALHQEAFEEIDCLSCANCCKTTSPIFQQADITRIAAFLGIKEAKFEREYLKIDDEGDWVLQTAPCPFLDADNYCSIYSHRPRACREYPHTDRKRVQQLLDLSIKNTEICPAVFRIFQSLSQG